ncbi:MAG: hypothetical protein KBB01_01660 [Candidatus Omnitrophica bacterium]|jgi:multicomponent Na+:H+ antiporter subunit B|nr:hypothetical protein [Candidatus Omnitrophota bacterium]
MKGMSLVVKRITRYTVGLILLYGIYIVLHGHLTPGGGFAGGVIIALSFIHLVLAFGKEEAKKSISPDAISLGESLGAIFFLAIGLIGLSGGSFFFNFFLNKGEPFKLLSAGTIPLSNIAIGLKVGTGLFAIFTALSVFRINEKEGD